MVKEVLPACAHTLERKDASTMPRAKMIYDKLYQNSREFGQIKFFVTFQEEICFSRYKYHLDQFQKERTGQLDFFDRVCIEMLSRSESACQAINFTGLGNGREQPNP